LRSRAPGVRADRASGRRRHIAEPHLNHCRFLARSPLILLPFAQNCRWTAQSSLARLAGDRIRRAMFPSVFTSLMRSASLHFLRRNRYRSRLEITEP
jgi:hypothetical protein